ncbi:MAG: hypothetical protein FLDDKLPJ_01795 [Phycisphaerae bacterium]|nr:hypothetical protein [Phycisphaerae bacterium]
MNRLPTYIASLLLVFVLGAYLCTFQVRSSEVAILKSAGRPVGDAITEPGLQFRWPWPIQSVVKYDNRKRVLEDRTEETSTRDGKNVILTTYTIWRIVDPRKFHEKHPVEEQSVKALRSEVQTVKNAEFGQRDYSELVSLRPTAIGGETGTATADSLRTIEAAILARLKVRTADSGVEILAFGIKRLGLPQGVTNSIFDSMRAAQERKANTYTKEGEALAQKITSEAEAARQRILSAVSLRVSKIENEGQQKVSSYYKEFEEHPELRIFLDNLAAMKRAFATRTTLIFDTTGLPFSVFLPQGREAILQGQGVPDLAMPRDARGTAVSEGRDARTVERSDDRGAAADGDAAPTENATKPG